MSYEMDLQHIQVAMDHAVDALQQLQNQDGHWCAELQGDSILESEYLLMKFILGQESEPLVDGSDASTLKNIAAYLRSQQREDGSWGQYPGAGVDISATVKAYFALKLMGDHPDAAHMAKAKKVILDSGGAECCNTFTNFYLACLGQVSWNAIPAIPPEIMLLPRWCYFHLNKVSAWTRTMIVPLSLVVTLRPQRSLPKERGIDELYIDERERHRLSGRSEVPRAWRGFFRVVDGILKRTHRLGGSPWRHRCIRKAEQWLLSRAGQDGEAATEGLGAIFPPMVYLQIALSALGYSRKHPVINRAERELDKFFLTDDKGQIRIQPCFSPVWDTGIALYALTDSGRCEDDPVVANATRWLREHQVHHIGDWAKNLDRPVSCGGWAFEYQNAWYPDVDDTAMVAMALQRAGGEHNTAAAERGVQWTLAMQNSDGGWAAFDKTVHRQILEYVPFADHNAMQDPSCADITGRVLECLSWHGFTQADLCVQRAISYIKQHQHADGCWFGRWGVNYIYGTWQAVIGPLRCGVDVNEQWVQRAGQWMRSIQKEDGSFGESADSYEQPELKGQGPSTASQTAWATMVLLEIYGHRDPAVKKAIKWLVDHQLSEAQAADKASNPDGDPAGSWHESEFTGTGFPRVFYLRYHLYRLYFPLMALARYISSHEHLGTNSKPAKVLPKLQQTT
ncbi:MAG: squalene--hopene cyclase [Phycisphaerales bacterium]|nr:squalene--hopene cyclase [Phycisphaerales bacterium]